MKHRQTFVLKAMMDISDIRSQAQNIQNVLSKVKLPVEQTSKFKTLFVDLEKDLDKYQKALNSGFKTSKDLNNLEKIGKNIEHTFQLIAKESGKFSGENFNKIFANFTGYSEQTKQLEKDLLILQNQLKNTLSNLSNGKNSSSFLKESGAAIANFEQKVPRATQKISDLRKALNLINNGNIEEATKLIQKFGKSTSEAEKKNQSNASIYRSTYETLNSYLKAATQHTKNYKQQVELLNQKLAESKMTDFKNSGILELGNITQEAAGNIRDFANETNNAAKETLDFNKDLDSIKNKITYFFSLSNAVTIFRNILNDAITTVKDLDAAMTETAVVTDFSVGDMWEQLPEYTKRANELGTTIQSAYEAATLYYQQGLDTNEVIAISNETLKMARIAGMDAAEATDMMTAALRGFNMELNEVSATRINDVYSELAAITAADTEEIATAMTKTASIAANAGMEFETTAAFLSQIVETTREAPETAGTALKTVIARFQELKKDPSEIGEVDGEIVDANKIETALKTIDVALRDTSGQFRDLDDVFLDIAGKWDSLDTNTQRYIATIAAGSRQQSRFIAMMSDYGRTMELVNAANNSAGASERQFGKTMESLEAKMNRLKNAWDEFTMSIANSTIIKAGVDLITNLITTVNKVTEVFGDAGSGVAKLSLLLMGLNKTPKIINNVAESLARIIKIDGPIFDSDTILGNLTKDSKKELGKFSDVWEDGIKNIRDNLKQGLTNNKVSKELSRSLDPSFISTLSTKDLEAQFPTENVKAYNAAKQAGIPIQQAMVALENAEIAAKVNDTIATDQNTAADIRNALGTEAGVVTTTKSTIASAAKTTATWLETAAVNALNAAMSVLNFLTSKSVLPFTILATAALGLAAAFKIIQANSPEAKLEKLRENTEKATKAAEESKKVYDDLVTSLDDIKQAGDTFKNLTVGTTEWKQALLQSNQLVLDLINKYPQLSKYLKFKDVGSGFQQFYLEEGYADKILTEQFSKVQATQKAYQTNLLLEKSGEVIKAEKDLEESKTLTYDSGLGEKSWQGQEAFKEEQEKTTEEIQEFKKEFKEVKSAVIKNASTLKTPTGDSKLQNDLDIKNIELNNQLQNTLSSYFTGENASIYAAGAAKIIDANKIDSFIKEEQNKLFGSRETLEKTYKDLTGIEPTEDLKTEDLKLEIATIKANERLATELGNFENSVNKLSIGDSKKKNIFLKGLFTGDLSGEEIDKLFSKGTTNLLTEDGQINQSELLKQLGISDEAASEFNSFLKETGSNINNLGNAIKATEWSKTFGASEKTQKKIRENYNNYVNSGEIDLSNLTYRELDEITNEKYKEAKKAAITKITDRNREKTYDYSKNQEVNEGVEQQQILSASGLTEGAFQTLIKDMEKTIQVSDDLKNAGKKVKKEFFEDVARESLKLGNNLKNLYDVLDENKEALAAKGTTEYYAALGKVKDKVKELTGVDFTEEEISKHLDLIQRAAGGSVSALEELQKISAKKLIFDLDLPDEDLSKLENQMNDFVSKDFEVGASLDNEPFIKGLDDLVQAGLISRDNMDKILSGVGAEPHFEWVPLKGKLSGPFNKWLKEHNLPQFVGYPKVTYRATGKAVTTKAAKTAGGYASSKSSSGGGGSSKKDPWENSLDKYYNLLEDINEELRIREKLERDFAKITEDGVSNSEAVLNNLAKQEKSLKRQKKLQEQLLSGRKSEMKSTLKENSKYSKYATYNWGDNTIEINWSAIDKVKDSDKGKAIEEYISELERIQESMDEASDAIADIDKDLKELKETGKDDYETLEEKILDAYIHNIESQIDNLENTYEAMSQATSDIMNKMQEQLSERRQARENQETEENISETERRLAYLRQDTSGANDLEILQLEKQLEEQKEDYTDTLIEQKIDELERQNSLAETQREEQIKLMKAQVSYAEKNGLYWDEIKALLAEGVTSKGGLKSGSTLDKLLKEDAGFAGMSEFQQNAWKQEMANTFEGADVYSQNNLGETLGGGLTPKQETEQKLKEAKKAKKVSALDSKGKSKKTLKYDSKLGWNDGTYTYSLTWDADKDRYVYSNKQKIKTSNANGYIASLPSSTKLSKSQIKKLQGGLNRLLKDKKLSGFDKLDTDGIIGPKTTAAIKKLQKKIGVAADGIWGPKTAAAFKKSSLKKYKTGGIADFTGPAWLDGTPSKPELVLNARDTENFIQLKNVLSDLMSDSVNAGNGGDNYYEIHIEVDEIANDYDVEKLATKVKKIIANDGMYRNVNTINMLR